MKFLFIASITVFLFWGSTSNAQNCSTGCSISIGHDGSAFTVTLSDRNGNGFTISGLPDRTAVERDISWIFSRWGGDISGANGDFIGNYVEDVFGPGGSEFSMGGVQCLAIGGCSGSEDPFGRSLLQQYGGW